MSSLQPKAIHLRLTDADGTVRTAEHCLSLRAVREYYTPYAQLWGEFSYSSSLGRPVLAELFLDGALFHQGLIDQTEIRERPGLRTLRLASRSHTSLLGQNELEPKLYSRPSLNTLMEAAGELPHVIHEDLSQQVPYLYVHPHTSLWEAVCNLCLKQYGRYPYIGAVNQVRFTPPDPPDCGHVRLSRSSGLILETSQKADYSKIISNVHMLDASSVYSYHSSDLEPARLGLARNRYVSFDKQWLSNMTQGLDYRIYFSMRGFQSRSVSYRGYQGEDLNSLLTFEEIQSARISKIELTGGPEGVATRLTCYYDRFCNTDLPYKGT